MPVPEHILAGLTTGVSNLGAKETYTGYGAEQGVGALRAKISEALYGGRISPEEVFVSDGSKCDIGRLQMMFGNQVKSAVQDPSYPVYVDTSVMMGQTQTMDDASKQYDGIVYMKCGPPPTLSLTSATSLRAPTRAKPQPQAQSQPQPQPEPGAARRTASSPTSTTRSARTWCTSARRTTPRARRRRRSS